MAEGQAQSIERAAHPLPRSIARLTASRDLRRCPPTPSCWFDKRLSRIFYRRRFFDYPLTLNAGTLGNLGIVEAIKIGLSYGRAQSRSRSPEKTLEDFLINRFGIRLYRTFFKDYTEKVWGVPCEEISAEWGAQRIKGLSVAKAVAHALASPFRSSFDAAQKRTETSLIERFLYPKFGPGQMWEEVARRVAKLGGAVHLRQRIVALERTADKIVSVDVFDEATGVIRRVPCGYFLSTIPVKELVAMLRPENSRIAQIAADLPYRSFMTAGLLLRTCEAARLRRTIGYTSKNPMCG